MLDFRINTFLNVCRYMNYTRAAKELCITQPAVTQHIQYLEKEYNTRLFEYEGRKLKLTPSGNLLYQSATTMLHDNLVLKDMIAETDLNKRPKIRFGATLTIGEYVMPHRLIKMMKKYPDTDVKMISANTQTLLKQLNDGDIDFAIIEGYFDKSEYDHLTFSTCRYVPVCSPAFSFKNKPVTLSDLLDETIILREEGSGTREILERVLSEKSLSLSFGKTIEIGSMAAIKHLVKNNMGITFLYMDAVLNEIKSGELVEIPLKDFDIYHDFYFIWRKDSIFKDYYTGLFNALS